MQRLQTLGVVALLIVVAVLTVTSLPSLTGEELGGTMLLVHMMASGALVFGLPLLAMVLIGRLFEPKENADGNRRGFHLRWLHVRWGWLACVATGLATIASVFLCMLPIASTETMHHLVAFHGYAGFAMVPATLWLAIGFWKSRRIASAR